MSLSPAVIDAMVAAGCTVEQLAAAMKADLAEVEARETRKREMATERKRRQRAKASKRHAMSRGQSVTSEADQPTDGHAMSRGQHGTERDNRDPSSPEGFPPTPPFPKTPSSIPPSPPKGGSVPTEFEKFWEVFPNRVGKSAAKRAFDTARRKVDFETLMAGLERYARKTDDRPWCNPATWLNQGRWEDEPAAPGAAKPQSEQPQVDWLARVQHFRKHEQWPHGWGPRPEEPGCRALMVVPIGDPLTPFIEKAWGRKIGQGQRTSTVPAWIYDDALRLKQEAQAA